MLKETIIGRTQAGGLKIPQEKNAVSGRHAKLTVTDEGTWIIEDLDSANGTYVRDDAGCFHKIYKKEISENTVIRLGKEGHYSFEFMARRSFETGESYDYEFQKLKRDLKALYQAEEQLERSNTRKMAIIKYASPVAMVGCVAAQYLIPGIKDDYELNMWITRAAMAIAPLAAGLFFSIDREGVKLLKQKRLKTITCPKCKRPLSDFDVNEMQCSFCKAK